MDTKRPRGREKNVIDGGTGVHKRGEGLGTGPVGSSNGYSGRTGNGSGGNGSSGTNGSNPSNSSGSQAGRAAAKGGLTLPVIIIAIVLYMVFGRGGKTGSQEGSSQSSQSTNASSTSTIGGLLSTIVGGGDSPLSVSAQGSGPQSSTSYSRVDTSVAPGSRAKRTRIIGNGKDQVTIMVYMCGTDLESQNGMATSDLSEMAKANLGNNINLLVYTGGCKKWQTSAISSSVNQIYQITSGGMRRIVENDGTKAMTDPNTLSSFIKWCAKNYPANRNELIFWDHGGGSVKGYGYDEKYSSKGSMNLSGINKALKNGGVKFDFIGFDTCLMATCENALMLNDYADYMFASEETEPGIGWYYTDWLTKFGSNTSMSTLEIGKNIVDDFVNTCASQCRGQKATLSVIDLAEFANTIPNNLSSFSKSISKMISNEDYQVVSDARYSTREFASSSKIDQVDLVDLCSKMKSSEGTKLASALKGAVKYNRTSSNMTNAYGVSIYFPYQRASYVDDACDAYEEIGMDGNYAQAIREFASMEVSGQVASGGSSSPVSSLLGMLGSSSSSSASSSDLVSQLLGSFMSSAGSGLISGLTGRNINFMEKGVSTEYAADYISLVHFEADKLKWTEYADGKATLSLPQDQWNLVHTLDMNVFYDDGEGYIDLGLDNIYDWTRDGALIAETDRTWLSINGQPVAYYHMDTAEYGDDEYSISGRVPAILNGQRVNLWLVFDNEHPYGYISGAQNVYSDGSASTVAKNIASLKKGDEVDFICDYYSYSGEYKDSYLLGETWVVEDPENVEIGNTNVGDGKIKITYRFTDIYNQEYWTPALER